MSADDQTDQPADRGAPSADDADQAGALETTANAESDGATGETGAPARAGEARHDGAPGEKEPARPKRSAVPGWLRRAKLVPTLLVALLVISAGLAAWSYLALYRPDQQTSPNIAHDVVTAASDGTVALLSYSPESVDEDFATAKSHLTGDFLSYYDEFTQQIVAPAAKEKAVHTTAKVMAAAVSQLHPDSAVVLVFVDQNTTSNDRPDPAMSASSVVVTLTKVDGAWLISKFDPV